MKIDLTNIEKEELELRHRKERDSRVSDRIKAVLLNAEGWTQKKIAQALRIRYETIQDHLNDYKNSQKLKPKNGGSKSHLTSEKISQLIKHLEANTYVKAEHICSYVADTFEVTFTPSGMTKWLTRNGFSYKKPKGTPAKADAQEQAEFIKHYEDLLNTTPEDEPIEFADAVHPTMATKITYGWIRKGQDKLIATTASRTRMNILGSINLETMEVTLKEHETIDSQAMKKHCAALRKKYPNAPNIHLILDRGSYNISKETKQAAEDFGIILHHLPPYSPNLNPIERLWKVMNEYVRNNRVFKSVKEFSHAILDFFKTTWPKIASSMADRINDNFQTLSKVSSS
jgi:transposase